MSLARAHVERVLLHSLLDAVAHAPTPALSEGLGTVSALYALSRLEQDRRWFLESGYLEGKKARAIGSQAGALCKEVRELSGALVEGLGVPEAILPTRVRSAAS